MRIAVDAHAIGRRITGNEVHVRSLLNALAGQAGDTQILAYVSEVDAASAIPPQITLRRVAANPFLRLGIDLAKRVRLDQS